MQMLILGSSILASVIVYSALRTNSLYRAPPSAKSAPDEETLFIHGLGTVWISPLGVCYPDLYSHLVDSNMKNALSIASIVLFAGLPVLAQVRTYDSRVEPPPHVFNWEDVYTEVGIWESAHADFNGGFLGSVSIRDSATATFTAGNVGSLEAREDASVLVLGVNADRIATRDRANIDLYGGEQSSLGQVLAGGEGAIRIYGGQYGWVLPWPGMGGRVEVFGGFIRTLSSVSQGVVVMSGGEADRLDASGEGGVSVLDSGTVWTIMSAGQEAATLVIAGGYPAPDIRLFGDARLIVLNTGGADSDYVAYGLPDFDQPGASTDFAGKEFIVQLGDGYKDLVVSAWSNTNNLSDNVWRGRLELVRIRDDIRAFGLAGGSMLLAFLAPVNQVLQWESSKDLASWQPWKAAFPGDGNTHVEVVNAVKEDRLFFRIRMWPKPGA
jgi:hypothetical protein